ncbi:MAG: NAD(+)/NADH kinase [Deltaproteobacteria bacterium]|nr:NAD(+)/NADH kinase [Deltaproteobacteria bacterium]
MSTEFEKIALVTRKTRLSQLVERFNSRAQARFYIEHAGGDFADYVREDDAYRRALEPLTHLDAELGLKLHPFDRGFLPTYLFSPRDVVLTVGQDGLVANAAKYVGAQPIVAVNPEPTRFDGVLLPFQPGQARAAIARVLEGRARTRAVTMAEVELNDGQRLLAFNDLYLGSATHVSSRYRIAVDGRSEAQSSSGVLVSTGAGSTGWLSSVFEMAAAVSSFAGGSAGRPPSLTWEDQRLVYVVREPFVSKHSQAGVVAGMLEHGRALTVESLMPDGGVIFSDGVEADFLKFNAGATARVHAAQQRARLVVG